jgi:hypothetical protein
MTNPPPTMFCNNYPWPLLERWRNLPITVWLIWRFITPSSGTSTVGTSVGRNEFHLFIFSYLFDSHATQHLFERRRHSSEIPVGRDEHDVQDGIIPPLQGYEPIA